MTTLAIDAAYDGHVSATASVNDTGTTMGVGFPSIATTTEFRSYVRFSLSGITAGSTVTDTSLQINVTVEAMEAGEGFSARPYNTTGDDDPEPDSGATKFTRAGNGSVYVSDTSSSTGSKTLDLGTTADTDVQGNISSPAIFSLGITHFGADSGSTDDASFETNENAGTDPATLTVVYTEPSTKSKPYFNRPTRVWTLRR